MNRVLKVFCDAVLIGICWLALAAASSAQEVRPQAAHMQFDDGPWVPIELPTQVHTRQPDTQSLTVRTGFDWPWYDRLADAGVYIPFLFDGGKVWINGTLVLEVPRSDEVRTVRWRRPFTVRIPAGTLKERDNVLTLQVPAQQVLPTIYLPRPTIASAADLVDQAEFRKFWVHGLQSLTAGFSVVVAMGMFLIWWRSREDTVYLLLAFTAILWGARAAYLLVETFPNSWWWQWRALGHTLTLGSASALGVMALRLSDIRLIRVEIALWLYPWLIGVIVFFGGAAADQFAGTWSGPVSIAWVGTVCIGSAIYALRRSRSRQAWVLLVTYVMIALAAVHDYVVYWHADWIYPYFPGWIEQTPLLLRYTFNLLMVVFVLLLVIRYTNTLRQLRAWNDRLTQTVAQREHALEQEFKKITLLERQKSALEERQRITQDLHDGLGSQLFTTLTQLRTGSISTDSTTEALQGCVDELRLALETLTGEQCDLGEVFANFRYRWTRKVNGMEPSLHWDLTELETPCLLPPQTALHIMRVVQEALTNALKHAAARNISIRASRGAADELCIVVTDDGQGGGGVIGRTGGFGLPGMLQRAKSIGADLSVKTEPQGTTVCLRFQPEKSIPPISSA